MKAITKALKTLIFGCGLLALFAESPVRNYGNQPPPIAPERPETVMTRETPKVLPTHACQNPNDLRAYCENVRIFLPDAGEVSDQEKLSEIAFYWPNLQRGEANIKSFDHESKKINFKNEFDKNQPALVKVRINRIFKIESTSESYTGFVINQEKKIIKSTFECHHDELGTQVSPPDISDKSRYAAFRVVQMSCLPLFKISQNNRFLFEHSPIDDIDKSYQEIEITVTIKGDLLTYRSKLPFSAEQLLLITEGNSQIQPPPANLSTPQPPSKTFKGKLRELFVVDPRTEQPTSDPTAERPILALLMFNGPIDDGKNPKMIKVREKGKTEFLLEFRVAIPLGRRMIMTAIAEPHAASEYVISPGLKIRGRNISSLLSDVTINQKSGVSIIVEDIPQK